MLAIAGQGEVFLGLRGLKFLSSTSGVSRHSEVANIVVRERHTSLMNCVLSTALRHGMMKVCGVRLCRRPRGERGLTREVTVDTSNET